MVFLKKCSLLLTLTLTVVSVGVRGKADLPRRDAALPLSSETAEAFHLGNEGLDSSTSGRIPNYLRALAGTSPEMAKPFAHLFKSVIYGGTVAPETKAAMGLKIAHANGSDYLAAHLVRLLKTTDKGRALLASGLTATEEKEEIALRYASDLNRAVQGVSDSEFAKARARFNDAQLVELTLTTCFFNYFSRFCQGAKLPLEPWINDAPDALPKPAGNGDRARVTLASDAELQSGAKLIAPSPNANADVKKGLGIGIANSQRAMLRVPDLSEAWWDWMRVSRSGAKLSRELLLHISFAVSMANGCRYCTVHQVVGLKRQGVDAAKLVSMAKDDSALTPRELTAVTFARKLTKSPDKMQESDFAALQAGLGDPREAFDALLQTCTFSFMNRFTDGLRLPSEDEAVKTYQEVYGDGSYRAYPIK